MSSRTLSFPRRSPRVTARPAVSAPVVGVRIGATEVALAYAADGSGPLSVRAAATAALPSRAVRDGEIVDAVAVAQALRQAVAGRSGFGKQVRIGIGCQQVAVRVLDLPPIEREEDVIAVVRTLARERIPAAADDALIDFRLLPVNDGGERTPGEPAPGRQALVVAARRALVDGHVAAVRAAGFEPVGVDLLAFALSRCVQPLEPTLLLDLDGVATLALAGPDGCRFVRTIPAGIQSAAEEIVQRTGVELGQAEGGLLGAGTQSEAHAAEQAATVDRTVRAIATTVRTSIDFHVTQEGGNAPLSCAISGPLAVVEGVAVILGETLDLPVRLASDLSGGADPVALGLSVEDVA